MKNYLHQKIVLYDAVLAMVCMAAFTALANVLARYLNTGFTPTQQSYLRAGIGLGVACVVYRKHLGWGALGRHSRKDWTLLAFRGSLHYGSVALAAYCAAHTLLSHMAFLSALPLVPLLGFMLFKERITWWKIALIVGCFAGVIYIAVPSVGNLSKLNITDLLVCISNSAFALSLVTRKWHSSHINGQQITTAVLFFGTLFTLLVSLGSGESLPLHHWTWALAGVLVTAGVLQAVAIGLLNHGFKHLSAVRADNIMTLKVPLGVLFGLAFYGELPGRRALFGGAIIVGCVICMNILTSREARHVQAATLLTANE